MNRRRFLAFSLLLSRLTRRLSAAPAWEPIYPDLGLASLQELRKIKADLKAMTVAPADIKNEIAEGRRWLAGVEFVNPPAGRWVMPQEGPRLRVLTPPEAHGVYLYIHGGGWCMGSALSGEQQLWRLAQATRLSVVTVDYRLAPEHPSPAALEDCVAAAEWVVREFPREPRFLGGGSAGGHLAALTLLRKPRLFERVVLWYGAYDLTRPYEGADADYPDLAPGLLTRCRERFLAGGDGRALSPLFAELSNLPPALFLAGDADLLFPDSLNMARAYAAAGNSAELVVYREGLHGFDGYPTLMTRDALARVDRFLRPSRSWPEVKT